MIKVKGNNDLVRDEHSRAIINTDSNSLKKAKNAKKIAMDKIKKEMEFEKRLDNLESKIDLILSRLG